MTPLLRGPREEEPDGSAGSAGFAEADLFFFEDVLGRAGLGAADHGLEAGALLACDESERAAAGAGEDGPVGVVGVADDAAGLFEQKEGAGLHLLRNPFFEKT